MPKILAKHSGSGARDANVEYQIERDSRIARISMTDSAGKAFFSSSHLLSVVLCKLVREEGIDVVVDDSASWIARRPEWTVVVVVGPVEYEARFNKLILGAEICIDLLPLTKKTPKGTN